MHTGSHTVTNLLRDVHEGKPGSLEQLIPVVYDELRHMAANYLQRDRGTPTLQPTALVHELYFKLVDQRSANWHDRAHFFATASLLMRRLIVDHARRHLADKRGGNQQVPLEAGLDRAVEQPESIVRIHEALESLAQLDQRQAKVVELRFFGGLSHEEAAEVLGVSVITAKRDWALARAWLYRELGE